MANDFEDKDHTDFFKFGDDGPVLSRAAHELHMFGLVNSMRDGDPGFVSDDYLEAISAETVLTALELCTAGLWERAEGGYRVLDDELLAFALENQEYQEKVRECEAGGGHYPGEADEEGIVRCTQCTCYISGDD